VLIIDNYPSLPIPIFEKKLPKISWKKIYAREYGVQYSEMAILCLSDRAKYHIPRPSVDQLVIPEGNNTAFYIDKTAWRQLVWSLSNKYTTDVKNLEEYESQFVHDGKIYLDTAKKFSTINFKNLSNLELKTIYSDYQEKLFKYSVFTWTAFILNDFVAERAIRILAPYLGQHTEFKEKKQQVYNALFHPERLAAVFKLQCDTGNAGKKLSHREFKNLYDKYKWLACLDIHNKPWTKKQFREYIKSLSYRPTKKLPSFTKIAKQLRIKAKDLEYLRMAKRFVYIKDARDDYRRQGVFYARKLFEEIARRMEMEVEDFSYLQESDVLEFLAGKYIITNQKISQRKNGFVLYLDKYRNLVCLEGNQVSKALRDFGLRERGEKLKEITGLSASKGTVTGRVTIVRGVKDLDKVKDGDILVAVATHPDYVPAMRRAAAIVTDEGGITSHAAIVSREFGIPCIVGTKRATKLLRDGDMVKVNTEKGNISKFAC
jgi:phosphohistidine swiveling domain-containing protein